MTQVTNTRTFYIPGNYLEDEHLNIDEHQGYVDFDHKLRFTENVRVPMTGQTTLEMADIRTTPDKGVVYQEFQIQDDLFIVDFMIPTYTVEPNRYHTDGNGELNTDVGVNARIGERCYPFQPPATNPEGRVDMLATSNFSAVTATLNQASPFPVKSAGVPQPLYENVSTTSEYTFDAASRQRFWGQFIVNRHHFAWTKQLFDNTNRPNTDQGAPFIRVRVVLKGGLYDPTRNKSATARIVSEAPFASSTGPYKAMRYEEPCRAPNTPSGWSDPWNEDSDVFDKQQLNQGQLSNGATANGQLTERLTDALIFALNNMTTDDVLWNPTEQESTQINNYGSLISVFTGRNLDESTTDAGGNLINGGLYAPIYKGEWDFFYKRVFFETLKAVRVHAVIGEDNPEDLPRVQISIRHGAFMTDLMTEPHLYRQHHMGIPINDRDRDNRDEGYTSGGFLSDSLCHYQESPFDFGFAGPLVSTIGDGDFTFNPARKARITEMSMPLVYNNTAGESSGKSASVFESNYAWVVGNDTTRVESSDTPAPNAIFGYRSADHGQHLSARITKHDFFSDYPYWAQDVSSDDGKSASYGVVRAFKAKLTLNMFLSVSIKACTPWGANMLGMTNIGQKLTGQCCPIVHDNINPIWLVDQTQHGVVVNPDNDLIEALEYNWAKASITRSTGAFPFAFDKKGMIGYATQAEAQAAGVIMYLNDGTTYTDNNWNITKGGLFYNGKGATVVPNRPSIYLQKEHEHPTFEYTQTYVSHVMNPIHATMIEDERQPRWPTTLDETIGGIDYITRYKDKNALFIFRQSMNDGCYSSWPRSIEPPNGYNPTEDKYNGLILINGFVPVHLLTNKRLQMVQKYYSDILGPDLDINERLRIYASPNDSLNKFMGTYLNDDRSFKRKDTGDIIKLQRGFIRPSTWKLNELRDSNIYVFIEMPSAASNNVTTTVDSTSTSSSYQDSLSLVAVLDSTWKMVYPVTLSLMHGSTMYNLRVVLKNANGRILRVRGKVSFFLNMVTRTDIESALV